MTALAQQTQPLYHSPLGLLGFQQEGVVRGYQDNLLAVWSTGIGKSHLLLALSALMHEDRLVDRVVLVCEQSKIDEWLQDFSEFTDLEAIPYGGPTMTMTHRRKIMEAVQTDQPVQVKRGWTVTEPLVLIGTYETFRNDLVVKEKVKNGRGRVVEKTLPGPLAQALSGQRLLIGYDEITKIGNRGSGLHKAQVILLKHMEQTGGSARLVGMTATPIDRDPEGYYNLGRLLCPEDVGTVASFEKDHVLYRDDFNRGTFKNLTPETLMEPWVTPLSTKMSRVLHRKRWTDPDVVDQFPEVSERFVHVRLDERHQEFYETVQDFFAEQEDVLAVTALLRMIAGHPLSLLRSQGKFAKEIVAQVGEDGLRALGSAKLDRLVERLRPIVFDQSQQAVVFTFFGPSMIPLIAERMESEGISVARYYPEVGDKARKEGRAAFEAGDRHVFLASDSGARGINLPQARYAFEYESATTHSMRMQRLNRVKRLTSKTHGNDHVSLRTLVAINTIEEPMVRLALKRNQYADRLLGDEDAGLEYLTAADRRELLTASRREAV